MRIPVHWIVLVLAVSVPAKELSPVERQELDSVCSSFLLASGDSCSIAEGCRKKHCAPALHLKKFARYGVARGASYASLTPPIFIDGKRYRSGSDPAWVIDAILYE